VQALALGGSLALSYAAAAAGAWATNRSLDDWYSALKKPSWTPPGAVIGAIWTVLYTLMGLSLWLGWRRVATADDSGGPAGAPDGAPEQTPNLPAAGAPGPAPPALHPALAWFAIQLGLNVLWSFAFFAARSTVAGLAVIVALWVAVAGWVRMVGRIDPLAGRLQLPYLGWVSFAGVLNATIWWRNRGPG
jgi:tryptophan-rich sensory protein